MQIRVELSEKIKSFALLCTAMVVGIHVAGYQEHGTVMWWWSRIGHCGVFLIAVPFFFTASGFFLAGHFVEFGWWRRECLKRIRSLLIPYVIWSVVAIVLKISIIVAVNFAHGRGLLENMPTSWRWWTRAFGVYPFCYPEVVPLWYLRTLMIFVFISPLLYCAVKWVGWRILLVIYLAHGVIGVSDGDRFHLFMHYTFTCCGLSFFILGMILRIGEYAVEAKGKMIPIVSLLMGILVLVVSFVVSVESRWFLIARMAFIPLFLYSLWNLMPTIKLPTWLCSAAFSIFLMHVLVWRLIGAVELAMHANCFGFLRPSNMVDWGVKWIVGFGGALALSVVLRKAFPKFACIAFGGR